MFNVGLRWWYQVLWSCSCSERKTFNISSIKTCKMFSVSFSWVSVVCFKKFPCTPSLYSIFKLKRVLNVIFFYVSIEMIIYFSLWNASAVDYIYCFWMLSQHDTSGIPLIRLCCISFAIFFLFVCFFAIFWLKFLHLCWWQRLTSSAFGIRVNPPHKMSWDHFILFYIHFIHFFLFSRRVFIMVLLLH